MRHINCALIALCCFFSTISLSAQNDIWTTIQEEDIVDPNGVRELFPEQAAYFDLSTIELRSILQTAPDEEAGALSTSSTIIPVPLPDGEIINFRVVRYEMLEPALAAKYPNIRNYKGIAVDDPTTTIRFDWTARGFRAVLRKDGEQLFIDPYSRGTLRYYMAYNKKDYPRTNAFECLFENKETGQEEVHLEKAAGDCQLRTYRLAVATTGEYSNFHGATSAAQSNLVLAEVNTAINRVNEVYERDLSVRLVLIGNNEDIFYYDGTTDPYTNNSGVTMLGENQTNINNVIGSANYDVGHVFSTGGGGVATLGVPCNNSFKARGVTGLNSPIGDPFYIDYVAHELGHQFGGNHTQNNSCQRSSASYEPGSASTIMGYAGICSPNVQNNSDAYFHAISIQEMSNYITNSTGDNCPVKSTLNAAPTATDPGDFAIPRGTPFVLSATASDPNSDPLTYCWEQWDPEVATMPPASTSTQGPLFRSLEPTTSPERYFINLPDLAAGVDPTWEELPTVARDMEFRLTVRDNNANYGCTDEVNIDITVTNSDPFVVQAPNTNITLNVGQTYTVQWDEAQTAQSPISCGTVDILLSTDGGLSFPTTILAGTTNDGSANVTIPNAVTTTARIMVKCATGIFFDISDTNFEIENGNPDYALNATPDAAVNCGANSVTYSIGVSSILGYTDPVTLSTSGLPAGASASFSPNPVIPGNSSTLTVSGLNSVSNGAYNFNVAASSTSGNKSIALALEVVTPSPANLLTPANGATGVSVSPTLTWSAELGATSYDVEVATDNAFTNVVASANVPSPSWNVSPALSTTTTYFWRVRHIRDCGVDPWSAPFSFTTDNVATAPCLQFEGGPYTNFEPPVCYPNCQTPTEAGFEVWANEAYLLRGLTVGAEYTFEFCNGYDPADWTANITAAEWDGVNATANVKTVAGCSITFTANVVDMVIIIFDTCGNPELRVNNGLPTFRCTGNEPTLPDACPPLPPGCTIFEDFESGQPVTGWTFIVSGTDPNAAWSFNAASFGSGASNAGTGSWANYDDDLANNTGENNAAIATSPLMDMSNFNNIELSFDYTYDRLGSEEVFLNLEDGTVTVFWDGSTWTTTRSPWLSNVDASGNFTELIPSGLNTSSLRVTLEYDDNDEWGWGFGFDNFSLCGDEVANPCPMTLAINDDPIATDTYSAENTITSAGTVATGTTVTFEAGQSVTLLPGFTAEAGSTFTARIQACATARPAIEERTEEKMVLTTEIKVFPNPFSQESTIEVQLAEINDVQIELFSLTGQRIRSIANERGVSSGNYQYTLNANGLNAGMYVLLIRVGEKVETRKLSLIK